MIFHHIKIIWYRNVSASNGWSWVTSVRLFHVIDSKVLIRPPICSQPAYRYMKDKVSSEMRFIRKVFGSDLLTANRTGFLAHIRYLLRDKMNCNKEVW